MNNNIIKPLDEQGNPCRYFKVFKRKTAIELRKAGFTILWTEPNRYKPQFDVWVFAETSEFIKCFNEINQKEGEN